MWRLYSNYRIMRIRSFVLFVSILMKDLDLLGGFFFMVFRRSYTFEFKGFKEFCLDKKLNLFLMIDFFGEILDIILSIFLF